MIREDQLDDENLNPAEGWSTIYQSLSLPNELAVFNWHNDFHKVPAALSEPTFVESTQKKLGGKEYPINRLVVKKILPSVPSGGFKLNGNEKIHAADSGDMNDLLENPAPIERLAEVK